MKKIMLSSLILVLGMGYAIGQKDSISLIKGIVIDKTSGAPLAGATIILKTSGVQTRSNTKGQFNIAANGSSLVVISFAEYETTELLLVPGVDATIIELDKKTTRLGEVTVISNGYTTTVASKATGAYTVVDKKLFNEQAGTTVLDRLKYITSGVGEFPQRIGGLSSGQLLIRGLSTFTSRIQKPLVVLDNFEYQGDLTNINPNDVENITILKDAAASAIWGAKAANGVIIITTKKGNYNQPLQVTLTSNYSLQTKPDLFQLKNISTTHFIDLERYLFNEGYYDPYFNYQRLYAISPVVMLLDNARKGLITDDDANAQINTLRQTDVRNEFERYYYRRGINHQQALSLQGGSGNYAWLASGGYDHNTGTLNQIYQRITGRLENKLKLTPRLDASVSLLYTDSRNKEGNPAWGSITTSAGALPPYTKFADDNGTALAVNTRFGQGYLDTIGQGLLTDWNYYPLTDPSLTSRMQSQQDLHIVTALNYRVTNGLRANLLYRYEKQNSSIQTHYDKESFYVRDLANTYAQIDYTNRRVKYIVPLGGILDETALTSVAQNIRGQLDYSLNRTDHSLVLTGGGELSETVQSSRSDRIYGYDKERLTFTLMDYANYYPTRNGALYYIPNPAAFTRINNRFVSVYSNANYSFRNRYTLSASARRDASNLFGLRINDKWKPLWSIGAGWDVTRESFFKTGWLSGLRLRASYGHQGNVDPSRVAVTTFSYVANNPYTQSPYGVIENYPNDNLRWEQSAMFNAGVDFIAADGRIKGAVDYYRKKLTDLYGRSAVDITAGIGPNIISNVGGMVSRGWDIKISSINLQGLFNWQSDLIINLSVNKVTKLNEVPKQASSIVGGGFLGIKDYDAYGLFAFRWAGLDPTNGNPGGYLDGQVSYDYSAITRGGAKFSDIVYKGSLIPKLSGSLGNNFNWKNLSLATRLTYKLGYVFKRTSIDYTSLVENRTGHSDYALRWQKSGDEKFTAIPSFIYPTEYRRDQFYSNAEVLVEKGDHLRLQYVNLSYRINKNSSRKLPFTSLEIHMMANNIGILWRSNKSKLDPDNAENTIPPTRVYTVGLTAIF